MEEGNREWKRIVSEFSLALRPKLFMMGEFIVRPGSTNTDLYLLMHGSAFRNKRTLNQKPLLRRFWPVTATGDINPHMVFRPRDELSIRGRLRRNRKNDASAYEKLQAIKADFERLRVVLLNVKKREQLKLSLLEYNKELFEQQMFDKTDSVGTLRKPKILDMRSEMFLEPKGLMKSSIASEVKVLARTADSLFDSDDPDVINSYSLELVMRRLYGFEKAFEFVEGEEGWRPPKGEAAKKWKSKVKWGLLDAYDLQSLEGKKLGIDKAALKEKYEEFNEAYLDDLKQALRPVTDDPVKYLVRQAKERIKKPSKVRAGDPELLLMPFLPSRKVTKPSSGLVPGGVPRFR